MPLSDSERRRLEASTHDLSSDDPRLALKAESGTVRHIAGAKVFLGSPVFASVLPLLLTGGEIRLPAVGVGVGGYLLCLSVPTRSSVTHHRPQDRAH